MFFFINKNHWHKILRQFESKAVLWRFKEWTILGIKSGEYKTAAIELVI